MKISQRGTVTALILAGVALLCLWGLAAGPAPGTSAGIDEDAAAAPLAMAATQDGASYPAEAAAPAISDVTATDITASSATITWRTKQIATSEVEYGETASYGLTASSWGYTASHSVGLRDLSAATTYHYRVKSSGLLFEGSSISKDFTFATLAGDDGQGPEVSGITVTGISGTGATITWTTNEDADTQVVYGLTREYGSSTALDPTLTRSHSATLSGLTAMTTYHYRVKSKDSAGNLGQSEDATFTTTDKASLAISGIRVTDITSTSANITWTTSGPADSQVEYGITAAYGMQTPLDSALVTDHRVALTGLSPSTTYHCRITSKDAARSIVQSGDYEFDTGDNTPPAISAVAATGITDTSAIITWTTDSPSEGHVEYGLRATYGLTSELQRDLVTSHSISITGLTAQTTYHYKVKSRDNSGLWAESGDYTLVTGVDTGTEPPKILFLTAANVTASQAIITWSTNEMATAQVEYGPTEEYGSLSALDEGPSTEHIAVLTGLESGQTYHYRVISRDGASNETKSADRTFRTELSSAPLPSLPVWAWSMLGALGVLAVGVLVLRNR